MRLAPWAIIAKAEFTTAQVGLSETQPRNSTSPGIAVSSLSVPTQWRSIKAAISARWAAKAASRADSEFSVWLVVIGNASFGKGLRPVERGSMQGNGLRTKSRDLTRQSWTIRQ